MGEYPCQREVLDVRDHFENELNQLLLWWYQELLQPDQENLSLSSKPLDSIGVITEEWCDQQKIMNG